MNWKELEDFEGFPKILRKFQVEAIGYFVLLFGLYKKIVPVVDTLTKKNNATSIIDLCSGSGLPSIYIASKLPNKLPILLTDKYPQHIPPHTTVTYTSTSVDCTTLQLQPNIVYTMYNAFHHFTKVQQVALLQHFAKHNATLLIVEIVTPTIWSVLQVILASTVVQLVVTPFIKPFNWLRLLFTYIIPINIITVLYDGVVSVLKAKSKAQYQHIVAPLHSNNYSITVRSVFQFPTQLVTIIATPI